MIIADIRQRSGIQKQEGHIFVFIYSGFSAVGNQ